MAVNRFKPHLRVIPEDDANRQLVNGFLTHHTVSDRTISVGSPAGGWQKVLEVFIREYIPYLNDFPYAHVVLLIDFDNHEDRRAQFEEQIPEAMRSRVFVIGSLDEPETLKQAINQAPRQRRRWSLEKIGEELANDCFDDPYELWNHEQLAHNAEELLRLKDAVKPFVFQNH